MVDPVLEKVELHPSKRAKRLALKALPNGRVRLVVPKGVPKFVALNFARKNLAWINKYTDETKHTYADGQKVGFTHRLSILESANEPRVSTRDKVITLEKPESTLLSDTAVTNMLKSEITKALRVEAKDYLPKRTQLLADIHGYNIKQVRIKDMTSRWGSCSNAQNINLNLHLMRIDPDLIDYVILHELTHTEHLNHSKEFWDRLVDLDPEAKQKAKAIKQFHPYL